jgi:C-terminal processing protease CtpA/Prc
VKASDLGTASLHQLGDFTESTPRQLRSTLTDLERKATSALVVDLRDSWVASELRDRSGRLF